MFRSIVLHDIPINAIAAMERWYWRDHSPEIVRRYGPWTVRLDSYLPVDAPADARAPGYYNWRLTEGWWREMPKAGPQGTLSFTPPPVWPKVAACFTPWQPTEDFLGWERIPSNFAPLRWFVMLRYPEGVSREQGEQWFLETHVKEVQRQTGIRRFFSYKTVDPGHLPGTWSPSGAPPPGSFFPVWHRVCELWYESFDAWRDGANQKYTAPGWAKSDSYPFFTPVEEMASTFVLERPTDEFRRDARGYV